MDGRPVIELAEPQAQAPAQLIMPCDPPVDIPAGAMKSDKVKSLWGTDRGRLRLCAETHSDLVQFYAARDKGLAGK